MVNILTSKDISFKPEVISGIKMASGKSGIKYKNRDDLLIISLPKTSKVCGIFTNSTTASPAVKWSKKVLSKGNSRAIIVNAGNANVFNGLEGKKSVKDITEKIASSLKIRSDQVLVAQTGVIGEPIDTPKIINSIDSVLANLNNENWTNASKAIMTTDTFPKIASAKCKIGDNFINITGIAKGSGMIAPDMATMLSFVMTDANLSKSVLKQCLKSAANRSFNSITVDGDTSTSDTVIFGSSCEAQNKIVTYYNDKILKSFKSTLTKLCKNLAKQIVSDGEGSSKLITIKVLGTKTKKDAKEIALSIANSPLVKTAISAGDPNWGRIIMAIGKSKIKLNPNKINLYIGNHLITQNGARVLNYNENEIADYMKKKKILVKIKVGERKTQATVWTCDFTKKYIDINGNYRS